MIQIFPLEQRNNYNEILDLYFNMVAMILPFPLEDVLTAAGLYKNEGIENIDSVVENFNKRNSKKPRNRNRRYKDLLTKYGISEPEKSSINDRFENDARLAKAILKEAFRGATRGKSLYEFLYCGMDKKKFHVNQENLCSLLMAFMDEQYIKQFSLDFDCKNKEDINEIFRYSKFVSLPEAIQFMGLLNVPVCPYCNRSFTTTITKNEGIRQGQFDHYRSKSNYPWFALSLYNLIPSCPFCNHIKSDKDDLVLYPYKEGMNEYYCFKTKPINGVGYLIGEPSLIDEFDVVCEIENSNLTPELDNRIKNSLNIFHLEKLYKNHQAFIVQIFRQRYIFNDTYLQNLCETFSMLFLSKNDVKDMLYLRHISPEHWGEYPLSKLVYDIDKEITELEQYSYNI